MIEFRLPSLGADMEKGKLLEWKVAPGQNVARGDVVAVVDTSKAAVDVEIWEAGTIHELIGQPGKIYPVGALIARLLAPGEAPGAAVPSVAGPTPAAAARQRVSPAARKRAAELGIALEAIAGTGPEGAVTLQDVEASAASKAPAPAAAGDEQAAVQRAEARRADMQRAVAAAMSRSKREIPHYYLSETIALRKAGEWLERENGARPVTERLLMAALFLKAVALSCVRHPEMNGFFRDGSFVPSAPVHLGVAISLRQGGLVAPAILDAHAKSLSGLMRDLSDLVKRVRAGSLRSSEVSSPTITVTNLGDEGVEAVHGVIYPPQVALVGFGKASMRAWVEEGRVCALRVVTATLAADHRVSNGHRGALFLADINRLLQAPETL
jgi:pyruvate dehydrogenase E2 component (dihydrolipoamide acetyltransferase)